MRLIAARKLGVANVSDQVGVGAASAYARRFPTSAGILFGLGMGALFDGIVLHQILQWHHMLSNVYPINSLKGLQLNTLWDGLFHACAYFLVALGFILLWRNARNAHPWWSGRMFVGTVLMGFGSFNVVEGLANHEILGIHHVNEQAPPYQWVYWDVGFLIWGTAMLALGWRIFKSGRREVSTRRYVISKS
jgi:uncharacterized membrane protein